MFQQKHQLSIQTNPLSIQDSSVLMQVDQNDTSIVAVDGMQNGGASQSDPIVYYSKRLQDELHALGQKIKQHEDNLKLLNTQRNKLDDSILDLQVTLGKYHSSSVSKIENDRANLQSEEETTEQILLHEKSAAGVLCQLKSRHGAQVSHLTLTKDVLGIVASLGKVGDENLSSEGWGKYNNLNGSLRRFPSYLECRLFSEYLGVDTMLAVVCKTEEGVKALETYDNEGCITKSSGLHGLGASIGRAIDGRFLVICLENLRPFAGDFVADDPLRKLDLLKPRLANGETPPGFLGFAVNMMNIDSTNLFHATASGYGLRETLFYNIFSRLQVYRTRAEMLLALPLITDGAVSLDGGMIRNLLSAVLCLVLTIWYQRHYDLGHLVHRKLDRRFVIALDREVVHLKETVRVMGAMLDPIPQIQNDIVKLSAQMAALGFRHTDRGCDGDRSLRDLSPIMDCPCFMHRGKKLELPLFHGDDAFGWLFRAERYFEINGIPEIERVIST
ncbi:hypothetical protein EZV62_024538 [Acer yangbiense]|uniref:Uncharacterized protein n=1 Tax=Acer yangbiense TaxID=1000413 RepID=A0A5C7GVD5_9ROSI|nr:hypothetical protein EZV62_024538 [Acer yangbiense]